MRKAGEEKSAEKGGSQVIDPISVSPLGWTLWRSGIKEICLTEFLDLRPTDHNLLLEG